ncbi:non-ribosomal peptide synthetase, partial [Virgisporangium aurantiacum]|uniref:non-ribosomal peptide synthetase n=1 Tax=Virgisporangium aurantiacum TaxID=175570 RepID=UPI00194FFAD7
MRTTAELLSRLRALGVVVRLDNGRPRFSAPRGALSDELRAEVAARREEIVEFLRQARADDDPIRPHDHTGPLPLSFAQQRMWLLHQLEPHSARYNSAAALRLTGTVDEAALRDALTETVARHAVLRTTFTAPGGIPHQVVNPPAPVPLSVTDLSGLPADRVLAEAQRVVGADAAQPFDLTTGPVLRARLIHLDPDTHVFALTTHHIVSDEWSVGILHGELSVIYDAFRQARPSPLPPLPVQYADFAVWQRSRLRGAELDRLLTYWRRQLTGAAALELPTDRARPAVLSSAGATVGFVLPPDVAHGLRSVGRRHGVSMFMTLLAAFQVLLARHADHDDIAVGTPIANRTRPELEPLIGFFANTLVLRTDLTGNPTFAELLQRVRRVALDAYAHQDLPFDRLVEDLEPDRDLSRDPLFQVMFTLHTASEKAEGNGPAPDRDRPVLSTERFPVPADTALFDLRLAMTEHGGTFGGEIEYSTDLFDCSRIQRMVAHLVRLLTEIAADPDRHIRQLPMLPEAERHRVLVEWNRTGAERPGAAVHELVSAKATATPDAVAVVADDGRLTYAELDRRANRLARRLIQRGAGPETAVAVCVERGLDLLVCLLAVFKAGAVYCPLDPDEPPERLSMLMEQARPVVALTHRRLRARLPSDIGCLCLDDAAEAAVIAGLSDRVPGRRVEPHSAAYLFFTSGSTGRPKGVVGHHAGLANRLWWARGAQRLEAGDRFLHKTPVTFDVSLWELLGPLVVGARVVLARPGGHRDPVYLAELIARERVTVAQFVPSMLRAFLDGADVAGCASLRLIVCSGEALPADLVRDCHSRLGVELHNLYGPTEASIEVTAARCDGGDDLVDIGSPIANLTAFVLDRDVNPAPIGVPGELCVGGVGVTRGYLDDPAQTARRFVADPFAADGSRLYRTGDRARWRPDGRLEYLGRIDDQVKVRGFRIEPGEVEAVLAAHPQVRQAVVGLRPDSQGNARLVAWLLATDASIPDRTAARLLAREQVAAWRAVWETAGHAPGDDPEFDTGGWVSSRTGQPIPADEMREWVDGAVDRIVALSPRRVLEIGCGTGLLLWRIAPGCERYVATDLAGTVLDRLRAELARRDLSHVTTVAREASDFTGFEPGDFDLVILNSVVQYFPDRDYLDEVLAGAARLLRPGGHLFIGDVRNLVLLRTQHAWLELARADEATRVSRLRSLLARRVQRDSELAIDPRLFAELGDAFAGAHVQVLPKLGGSGNEMTLFRYDVIVHTHAWLDDPPQVPQWLDWPARALDVAALRALLADPARPVLGLRRVPNARLIEALASHELIDSAPALSSAGNLRAELSADRGDGIDPAELVRLAGAHGYHAELSWASAHEDGRYDVVLAPATASRAPARFPAPEPGSADRYTNNPLGARLRDQRLRRLGPALREHVSQRLPEHMRPAHYVFLDSLPLTTSGKVDRRALPEPDPVRPNLGTDYVEPRTPTEEVLAEIWAGLLGVDRVGAGDNFFDLGGHSILATQVVSRVRTTFEVELPLAALFETPVLNELAGTIDAASRQRLAPPLVPAGRDRPLPLSFAQQRLWFLDQFDPGSPEYNVPMAIRLRGPLDLTALRRALTEIAIRHEALRTTFQAVAGVPRQDIRPPRPVPLPLTDLSTLPPQQAWRDAERLVADDTIRPFDLTVGPLFRAALLRLQPDDHVLTMVIHHIIIDEWSLGLILGELSDLYEAFRQGHPSPLPPLPVQFADFAVWQRDWLQEAVLAEQLAYWRRQLGGAPTLELPTDRPRPPVRSVDMATTFFVVPPPVVDAVRALSRRQGVTTFMTMLAAFQTLLGRYAGQDDVSVGTPVADRTRTELEDVVGFFVNTLVLRTDLSGDPTFAELLHRVREVALGAFAHQDLPFEQLVEELQPLRAQGRSPLLQVIFYMERAPEQRRRLRLADLELSGFPVPCTPSEFDLHLTVSEDEHELTGVLKYGTDLFDPATMTRFADHLVHLLTAATQDPQRRLSDLPLVSEEQERALIDLAGAGGAQARFVTDRVAAWASRTPQAVAVIAPDGQLSYAALDARANQLARRLRVLGVGPETVVGVCLDRGLDLVVAFLATLKAGAVYLPLDPSEPLDRLARMLDDAKARVAVAHERGADQLPADLPVVVCLDDADEARAIEVAPTSPVPGRVAPEQLAYLIYTSGSTGMPKGVGVTHGSLANLVDAQQTLFGTVPSDRVLQFAPAGFDAWIWEAVMALTAGAGLVVASDAARQAPTQLAAEITRHGVSIATLPPALLQIAEPARFGGVATVVAAGERLPADVAAGWASGRRLLNAYGPTETTVCATAAECRPGDDPAPPPIGRPIGNATCYVLDTNLRPVPIGVAGELYVGGAGVARGYVGRPDLTAQRFVADRFAADGSRLYRTGDRVRWRADGQLDFLGRLDDQLKVRGYRVEPAEIEAALRTHPRVGQAVVGQRPDPQGRPRLVAWIVTIHPAPHADGTTVMPTVDELRGHLADRLPDYMLPSAYVPIDAMPLTSSGKVNQQALPDPESVRPELGGSYVAPRTPTEVRMADVWAGLFGLDRVGADDDFFELGGHSLLAAQVVARAGVAFGMDLPLATLFETPTVAGLAAAVDAAEHHGHVAPVAPVPRDGDLPLSFGQQRLWFLHQLDPASTEYNTQLTARLLGQLDIPVLERAVSLVVARHEILRTTFVAVDGVPRQEIAAPEPVSLPVLDLSSGTVEDGLAATQRVVEEETTRPFDLARGPLLRSRLLRLGPEDHVLVVAMHHIICDEWSTGILRHELAVAYTALRDDQPVPLAPLHVQYADYAVWQRGRLQGPALERQLDYWGDRLSGVPVLELPADRPRPATRSGAGAALSFTVDEEVVAGLRAIGQRHGATMFMVLLAAFNVLLSRYTGRDDVAVGSPISNRGRPETQDLIGFFVNTLVLRTDLAGDPSFVEVLGRVRETALGAFAHQDMPFEQLVEQLHPERDLSRTPLFQILFNFIGAAAEAMEHEFTDLDRGALPLCVTTSKFDLTLTFREGARTLFGVVEYSTDLFDESTIERLVGHLQT